MQLENRNLPINRFDAILAEELEERIEFMSGWHTSATFSDGPSGPGGSVTVSKDW